MRKFALLGVASLVSLTSVSLAVTGGLCAYRAACYGRPSYNACMNCTAAAGCGTAGEKACWNWFRRMRTPGNPETPEVGTI